MEFTKKCQARQYKLSTKQLNLKHNLIAENKDDLKKL